MPLAAVGDCRYAAPLANRVSKYTRWHLPGAEQVSVHGQGAQFWSRWRLGDDVC